MESNFATTPINITKAKEHAAKAACSLISDDMVVGVGSGSTVFHFIQYISRRIENKELAGIQFVPTSFDTQQLLTKNGMKYTVLDENGVDIVVDGADEVSASRMLVKGGGGAHLQEKIVYTAATKKVIIVDWNKKVDFLGSSHPIPVEIASFGWQNTKKQILSLKDQFTIEKTELRMAKSKLGPVVTDNSNFILDITTKSIRNPIQFERKLLSVPGILATGLFTTKPNEIIVGTPKEHYFL